MNGRKPKTFGTVKASSYGFRSGTKFNVHVYDFVLMKGGVGDQISLLPTFEFIGNEIKHVIVKLWVTAPVFELFTHVLKPYENIKVFDGESNEMEFKPGEIAKDPRTLVQYIGAPGAHLIDLGFMVYLSLDKAPAIYETLPVLENLPSAKSFNLPENFGVITTGFTWKTRRMKPQYINTIAKYMVSKNITPVFLGKKTVGDGYNASFDSEVNYDLGVDLREQTTLMEAATIINDARFVLGIDNGLLHLAGCTKTPIIFGHTVTTIRHREIRRRAGVTINIVNSEEILECAGCQSRMRLVHGQAYKFCHYGDYKCLDLLFRNNCQEWLSAIDKVMAE